jgi:hypothetical protein
MPGVAEVKRFQVPESVQPINSKTERPGATLPQLGLYSGY